MKRLIVNADDLGLTRGVNRAIAEAHQHGVLTSATLMANGPEFDDGATVAKANPALSVGCHVDLIQLSPMLPAERLKTLAPGGRFRKGLPALAAAALRGHIDPDEITAEAIAQIRKLRSAGISVSHFDSHKHTHVFPPVARALLRAAQQCGVAAVRNPFEPRALISGMRIAARPGLLARAAAVRGLRVMGRRFRTMVEAAGMTTTDGTLGIVFTGYMDQQILSELIRHMPEGTWELVTHPGYPDAKLEALGSLTASRETELRLLTSDETRRSLEDCGIQLISYEQLAASASR